MFLAFGEGNMHRVKYEVVFVKSSLREQIIWKTVFFESHPVFFFAFCLSE